MTELEIAINECFSYTEPQAAAVVKPVSSEKILPLIASCMDEKETYVYAVMDHGVALGIYRHGRILIGMGQEREVIDLPLAYVQELRVFNNNSEFRALRGSGGFRWRLRIDERREGSTKYHVLNEKHKLWGQVKKASCPEGWSLLSEDRGSAILFPKSLKEGEQRALLVRNYIEIHDADKEDGLVHFVDDRLYGFAGWLQEEEKNDGK